MRTQMMMAPVDAAIQDYIFCYLHLVPRERNEEMEKALEYPEGRAAICGVAVAEWETPTPDQLVAMDVCHDCGHYARKATKNTPTA